MPGKKKKYNARFPPARIKKIMQSDEEVGKVAAAVPVIISRALELFVDSLLRKANDVATRRNAKTLTPSHLKMCINSDSRFDFLKDLVSNVADLQGDIDDATQIQTQGTAAGSDSMFQFPKTRGTQKEDHKFLQFNNAEPQDLSQKGLQHDVPVDLRRQTNHLGPKSNKDLSFGSKEFITNIPSTSSGKKRGRPRKTAVPAESSSAPQPKRKSRDSATNAGSYQYYQGSTFPCTKDPSNFENAKNVGRVCDEDEDDLGASGDEEQACKSSGSNVEVKRHHSNGTVSGKEQQKPMQNFVLSMKNGSNDEDPAFVLLPQLGSADKIKIGCDDEEDSNALVVDEDYDC